MKKNCIFIILFILSSYLYAQEFYPNKISVKFRDNSVTLSEWKANNRSGEIEYLNIFLGKNDSKPMICNELISWLKTANNSSNQLIINKIGTLPNIENIAIITYANNIDPLFISRKISSMPEIQYAEPVYIHKIIGIPNDTLLGKQYYIGIINAIDAWDYLDTTKKITIGIVDTGVDFEHPDLVASMFVNPGEDGLDSTGNDRRMNGLDDDKNGFIDDWHGYDFNSSSDSTGKDNDPSPGNAHGTHVSGICAATVDNITGIAGVSKIGRILPVKVGSDNSSSGSLGNSYEGILYAALMKASVINCSWGSGGRSQSEQDIIDRATNLGSLIVAAAGNDNSFEAFYPAAYDGVFSVSATDAADKKAYFSNYHSSVDIAAPGASIMSTIPFNDYSSWDGTSMSSPVAAGVAVMVRAVFPDFTPIQVQEQIRATSDSLYNINPYYLGKLGKGRVNAFKAVSNKTAKLVSLKSFSFNDENNNKAYEPDETVTLNLELVNLLRNVGKITVTAKIRSEFSFKMINGSATFDTISTNQTVSTKETNQPIKFVIPSNIPSDYEIVVDIDITDNLSFSNSYSISVFANPTYRTISKNNITTTITSLGKFAYNDYPSNVQGDGFQYKSFPDLIYEASLIIGNGYSQIANNARGSNGSYANNDFEIVKSVKLIETSNLMTTTAEFKSKADSTIPSVNITYKVYQFVNKQSDTLINDMIFLQYDVVNNSGKYADSLFLGMYHDWDIGISGAYNYTKWIKEVNFGYAVNKKADSLPYIGFKQITAYKNNYFAIDNNGKTEENPGVYDGFSFDEKWRMLTNGIGREESGITDVSAVIGAGPIRLRDNDTARVIFAIFAGNSLQDLTNKAKFAQDYSNKNINLDGNFTSKPKSVYISNVTPNPNFGEFIIEFGIPTVNKCSLEIYDYSGKLINEILDNNNMDFGIYQIKVLGLNLAQGKYFLNLKTDSGSDSYSLIIQK